MLHDSESADSNSERRESQSDEEEETRRRRKMTTLSEKKGSTLHLSSCTCHLSTGNVPESSNPSIWTGI